MELKKCIRCGCFFTTEDNLCPNCQKRDDNDKKYLKSFIETNGAPSSVQELSFQSGLSLYDINRSSSTFRRSIITYEQERKFIRYKS